MVKGTGEVIFNMPVTGGAKLPSTDSGYEVKSTISPSTGETHLIVSPVTRPLFAFMDEKEVGMRYGLASPEIDVYGRYTFLRIGNFYGSVYAGVSGGVHSSANIMAEVSYRW